jgi:hypothetical protein
MSKHRELSPFGRYLMLLAASRVMPLEDLFTEVRAEDCPEEDIAEVKRRIYRDEPGYLWGD